MRKLKSLSQAKIDALIADLTQYVFIGDFIGNQELINLIKYSRETICFHSVISKERSASTARQTMYSEVNSFEILQRHALDVVPSRQCGRFGTYDELCVALADIHKQVVNSSLSASEEGAVLTFIRRATQSSDEPEQVISMCKIKSVEYSALRLMVDMMQAAVESDNLARS